MNPFRILLLFFLTVPIIEIYLLLKIGGIIGVLPTVILVASTAMLGATLLRSQGLSTLKRLQDTLSRREIPSREIVEGPLLLLGGALLLTPGFFTDVMGLYLLIPYTRKRFVKYLFDRHFIVSGLQAGANSGQSNPDHGVTIEGDFKRDE
ncbi:MAG: FxsA family protein [Methylococcales bacterium]